MEVFCQEYIVDLNGTRAAKRAGYSRKTAGSIAGENLKKPEIQARIRQLLDERAKRTFLTADQVVLELQKIAFASLVDYVTIGPDGLPYVDMSDIGPDELAALSEATIDQYWEGKGEDAREILKVKVKQHDKLKALDMLAKHLGMYQATEDGGLAEKVPLSELLTAMAQTMRPKETDEV